MAKLSRGQREHLDREVLVALRESGRMPTSSFRDFVRRPDGIFREEGIDTPDILRACRRLEQRGYIEQAATSCRVMKVWQLTDEGRASHEAWLLLSGYQVGEDSPQGDEGVGR